jgi:hypothetical protein
MSTGARGGIFQLLWTARLRQQLKNPAIPH